MRDFDSIRRAFRLSPQSRREIEREVDDELEAHIAMRMEHLVARGMSPEAARAETLRRLGDLPTARAALIDSVRRREGRMRFRGWLESVRQDSVHALRQIRRAPGFSALAIVTFALGIGLTTAVFAAVDGVLLRPLPYAEADRLVALQSVGESGNVIEVVSSDNWYDWHRGARTLEGSAIYMGDRTIVRAGTEGVRASYMQVSPGFFDVIRPRMLFGRGFTEEEAQTQAPVVVISEGLWRTFLGGRPFDELTISLGERSSRVIGVVAAGQEYPAGTEVWLVYRHTQRGGGTRNNINWSAVGRLARGVPIERADEELDAVARSIRESDPAALYSWGVHVMPLRDVILGKTPEYLRLLMGAVGFVMLIACANLAGANLARGASRAREMAVRAALGAGRWRIARQLFVEHLVLALLGGAAGVVLAWFLTRALSAAASEIPRASEIGIDARVAVFAFSLAAVAGLLAGMLPARDAARASLRGGLTGSGHGVVRGGRGIPGRILVGFEVAIAVLLVIGAGLLVQSFRTLIARPLGFETRTVVAAEISLIGTRYAPRGQRVTGYWPDLMAALRTIPGVEGAAIANWIPLGTGGSSFIEVEGKDLPGAGAGYRVVSEGYFNALDIPLLTGRDFGPADDSTAPRGVLVNRAMAELYWPGESPIGRRVRAPSMESRNGVPADWLTVIGVVGDVRHWGYESEFRPEMYVSYRQTPFGAIVATAVVRGSGSTDALVQAVRERIRVLDATVPADIEPLEARADRLTADRRLAMSLLTVFGCLALLLAAVGVYALLSFSVSQRTREMAVRSALGADRRQIVRLVIVAGAWVVALGIAVGTAGAFALSKLMSAFLFEVSPHDPKVIGAAVLVIALVGLLAAAVPALRASRVEPMLALKGE
jgi:predicted permease